MGYLTTITIYNDALHKFKEDPKAFGEAVLNGIDIANREQGEVDVPFDSYANYISIQPSSHADVTQLYLHSGNGVLSLNPWGKDFLKLVQRDASTAHGFLKKARFMLTEAQKVVNNTIREQAKS